jgi:hypothetical protein
MSRHATPAVRPVESTVSRDPLIAGPRWYRTRIRVLGPLLGLVPMGVLGAAGWLSLRLGEGRTSGLIGLVGGVSAAPGLLVAGAPFADDSVYPRAVLASVPLWLLLGLLASRRATRSTIASWRDYWREMLLLSVSVVVGAIVALIVAAASLTQSLVV